MRSRTARLTHSNLCRGERLSHGWASEYRACRSMDSRSAAADFCVAAPEIPHKSSPLDPQDVECIARLPPVQDAIHVAPSVRKLRWLQSMPKQSHSTEQLDELERLLRFCEVQAVRSGTPLPLGARVRGNGVNFAIFSRNATGVRLDLFDHASAASPARSIILDATRNKTGDIWHVWLEGIRPGQLYGFRIAGPYAPHDGHRFNPNKLVIDPYATAISAPMDHDPQFAVGYDPSSPEKDLSYSDIDNAGSAA